MKGGRAKMKLNPIYRIGNWEVLPLVSGFILRHKLGQEIERFPVADIHRAVDTADSMALQDGIREHVSL
jgi:hypothetical protein